MDKLFTTELVNVTPQMAREWLKANRENRNIRPPAVAGYAADMRAGHWKVNGEAVKFAEDGALLDGQHRLRAVIEAGVTVPLLVCRGLDPSTQATMDSGAKRTTVDVLALDGQTNASIVSAVVKRCVMWERGEYRFKGVVTTSEVREFVAVHPEVLRSVEMASVTRQAFRQLQPSVTGTAHWLLSAVDPAEAPWFFARLADGAEMKMDHPILTVRKRILDESYDRKPVRDYQRLAYVIRAWNAVREGRALSRVVQPADAPMPMPR